MVSILLESVFKKKLDTYLILVILLGSGSFGKPLWIW